jgi:hypothetical protein
VDWKPSQIVVVDILSAIVLALFALNKLATFEPPSKPSIESLGKYVVEVAWTAKGDDDVDSYVEDPAGNIAYFAAPRVGLMHLEQDDLGKTADSLQIAGRTISVDENRERVVLRGTLPGEYVVNAQMYRKDKSRTAATPVRVTLYRLRGIDRVLKVRELALRRDGDELTAFRFRIDQNGDVTAFGDLPKTLVGSASGFASPMAVTAGG